jgi:2,4-dienoyl-CoA reductase (NADPH2)
MASHSRFAKLLEPAYIGKVRTRARLIRCGAHVGWRDWEDGYFNAQYLPFYRALARGGAGLVTVASPNIDYPIALLPELAYRLDDDKYIDSFKKVTEAIHAHDCPAFLQLMHIGPMFPSKLFGLQPLSSSSIPKNEIPHLRFEVARELGLDEIHKIQEKFVDAAARAQKAGFDGIELNGGCNHLLNSFLSAAWNRRRDAYGADSLENRARFVTEIIHGIKKRAGRDFAVVSLINGAEFGIKDGITSAESQGLARLIEAAGADAIHVRVEYYLRAEDPAKCDSTHFPDVVFYPSSPKPLGSPVKHDSHGEGGWLPLAAAIKHVVKIPVIAVGRMRPELSEKALKNGMVDFVNMNRLLMADPELPNKLREGREEDVAPCTACMTCFDSNERFDKPQGPKCRINPDIGLEFKHEDTPIRSKKTVVVAGGGPAGMEAARVAAARGHRVVLLERSSRLGGSLNAAGTVKGAEKENLESIVRYYRAQLRKKGVEVKLNSELNKAVVAAIKPDTLIVAAGGKHRAPDIPGMDRKLVLTGEKLHRQLRQFQRFLSPQVLHVLTKLWLPVGRRVVILGGGIHGCQVAEFLVKRNRQVTILETGQQIGEGLLEMLMKPQLLNWLTEHGVVMMTQVKWEEVVEDGIVITKRDGTKQTLKADTIITALPLLPDNRLAESLADDVKEIHLIGDCSAPGMIVDAIAAGAQVGSVI